MVRYIKKAKGHDWQNEEVKRTRYVHKVGRFGPHYKLDQDFDNYMRPSKDF